MVKLQRRFAYVYNKKQYHKYQLTIPEEIVEKLKWEQGADLKLEVKDGKLVIEGQK